MKWIYWRDNCPALSANGNGWRSIHFSVNALYQREMGENGIEMFDDISHSKEILTAILVGVCVSTLIISIKCRRAFLRTMSVSIQFINNQIAVSLWNEPKSVHFGEHNNYQQKSDGNVFSKQMDASLWKKPKLSTFEIIRVISSKMTAMFFEWKYDNIA